MSVTDAVINELMSAYDMIVSVPFRFRLRSADNDDMIVPRTRTAQFPLRSTPDLEHAATSSEEQFKSGLKTWLFVQAYS